MAISRIREIPYNYTSFSDQEIVTRFLGRASWDLLNELRGSRRTGRSARMLFEVLGDIWVVARNPFIQDDLISTPQRRQSLTRALHHRLDQILARAEGNEQTLQLVAEARAAVERFEDWLSSLSGQRQRLQRQLSRLTSRHNIDFGGLARVSHSTDATDWRVELPLAVISPDSEDELQGIVAACTELGLTIIPRGGGTGYTGGAVPLHADSVVINTEKLEGLGEVVWQTLDGRAEKVATVRAEAGVVTRRVADLAARHRLVFAVDPTSQDASTIGGNVAMNAGGKKAVLWGTTIDNLLSWRMVTPDATWLEVERLGHNLGKIHDETEVRFRITHYAADGRTPLDDPEVLTLPGHLFRKTGLGKDVTDKFLGGLPGIQKEGCDGLITSAVFVLHREPAVTRTVCLEFYGADLRPAVAAIIEIRDYLDMAEEVALAGLEHLDERYLKAIDYSPKAPRPGLPKVVLLADVTGEDEGRVGEACAAIVRFANEREGEGFVAVSAEARRRFWQDRSRTAAIAAHTNAFKINEDVVIPLERLVEYGEGIERINIVQSLRNKLRMITGFADYLREDMPADAELGHESTIDEGMLGEKSSAALAVLDEVRQRWQRILDEPDAMCADLPDIMVHYGLDGLAPDVSLMDVLRRRQLRISFRHEVERPLKEIFAGREFTAVCARLDRIHESIRSSRLFVALHMHAGDGNVHTNIPVNSNDYGMMHEAERIVDEVMALAKSLGGVISGEHGIGLTKMQYLEADQIEAFATYKHQVDPEGRFNRGKLLAGSGLEQAYTPSLRLLQQEALILEESDLGALNDEVRHCLRCGKCKPVCTTHVPRANLLYSPRNKILATGLIIEAFLYEEQTRRGISLRHFDAMVDVADHCTVCHRCLPACPVDIDFGDVSVHMRRILKERGQRRSSPGTRLSMAFLNMTSGGGIQLMRRLLVDVGFRAQRLASRLALPLTRAIRRRPPSPTTEMPSVPAQIIHFVDRPLPRRMPAQTMRARLGIDDDKLVPILRDPLTPPDAEAVFYFPGCGSERLFSDIGLATLAMLFETGSQTVLPPGYLCCGYPQISNGDEDKGRQITTANRVLFHRIANTLNYLDIRTVIVSCGTCMDQLLKYEFEQIFPGCRLLDIHEYLLERGVSLDGVGGVQYLYHDPCHTPIKTREPLAVASDLMGQAVMLSDRCCGEAGTFAVSRPDIASQVRFRKAEVLHEGIRELTGKHRVEGGEVKLLTSCPACQQGLSRYADETGLETDYMVVELARHRLGESWQQTFVDRVLAGGIERVLL